MAIEHTALDDWLTPLRAALVVVDMQNDYVATDGHFARNGRDVSSIVAIVPRIAALAEAARAAGVPVIYTRQTALPDGQSDSPARRRYKTIAKPGLGSSYPLIGTSGHDVFGALAPKPGDIVIDKFRSSAFHQTGLDLILRTGRREALIVCGAVTEGCIESTVRDAAGHDYLPVVVSDAIASNDARLHDAAMIVMSARFDAVPASRIAAIWQAPAASGTAA
jgi:nicotinamidase-related amidase